MIPLYWYGHKMNGMVSMTREDIKDMIAKIYGVAWTNEAQLKDLERFAALVASAEREKFCAELRKLHDSYSLASDSNAIRARGQE